jgi:hypothetical protein
MIRRPMLLALAAALPLLVAGCGSAPQKSPPTGVDGLRIPTPSADPDDFVEGIDNPFLPLEPGYRWVYESAGVDPETVTVTVTEDTKVVQGVTTTVVHDVVRDAEGTLVEDTFDWFAQDTAGNVWYFGEDTTEYDDRGRADDSGSWEAGVDGAQAGVAMLAAPRVGDGYQQESYPGEAEDRAEVLSLEESVNVAFGSFTDVLQRSGVLGLEWSPDWSSTSTTRQASGWFSRRPCSAARTGPSWWSSTAADPHLLRLAPPTSVGP